MFHHLLVPLDGSRLAESAIPAAAHIAERFHAEVTLLHVIERNAPAAVHGDRHLTEPAEADEYLERLKNTAFPEGVAATCHVHEVEVDNVARSIVAHSGEFQPDLIVLCTHGKEGVRELLFGSIAQKVLALGDVPILLIHPRDDESPIDFRCRRILLPLDGDPEHEQSVSAAREMAQACGAELDLIMIVPTVGSLPAEWAASGRLLPGVTGELLDIAQVNADGYLRNIVEKLKDGGISVEYEVLRGDPADGIVETASQNRSDLIVLGTHRKAGMDAFWSGSIAHRVTSRASVPLLLVPVKARG